MQVSHVLTISVITILFSNIMVTAVSSDSYIVHGNFIGFSFEVGSAPVMFNETSFISLMKQLRDVKGGGTVGPRIRIGGNSADHSWYPGTGRTPDNVTYIIKDEDLHLYKEAADAVNGDLVIDLNMGTTGVYAIDHMKAVERIIGMSRVAAVEISNEPDVFYLNGLRSPSWGWGDYLKEYDNYAAALFKDVPSTKNLIQGGTFCMKKTFIQNIPEYINEHRNMVTLSVHHYPLSICNNNTVSIEKLLAKGPDISVFDESINAARNILLPYWFAETNSVSCGGQLGVSDAFASALWALDYMGESAIRGVRGLNFHGGPISAYTAVAYSKVLHELDVRPLYYAKLLFSRAIAGGDNGCRVFSIAVSDNPLVKAYGMESLHDGSRRALVIDKRNNGDEGHYQLSVRLPDGKDAGKTATVTILTVRSDVATNARDRSYSKRGITIGGQTYDGSKDGSIQGQEVTSKLTAGSDGTFSVGVDGAMAVLIEWN